MHERGRGGMEESMPIQEGERKQKRMLETCIGQNHFPIYRGLPGQELSWGLRIASVKTIRYFLQWLEKGK